MSRKILLNSLVALTLACSPNSKEIPKRNDIGKLPTGLLEKLSSIEPPILEDAIVSCVTTNKTLPRGLKVPYHILIINDKSQEPYAFGVYELEGQFGVLKLTKDKFFFNGKYFKN